MTNKKNFSVITLSFFMQENKLQVEYEYIPDETESKLFCALHILIDEDDLN